MGLTIMQTFGKDSTVVSCQENTFLMLVNTQ